MAAHGSPDPYHPLGAAEGSCWDLFLCAGSVLVFLTSPWDLPPSGLGGALQILAVTAEGAVLELCHGAVLGLPQLHRAPRTPSAPACQMFREKMMFSSLTYFQLHVRTGLQT